ncbi:MAG TPA: NAD(P)H-hydrate epimerase [Actinomycetales bacterium]|nr:NAD(P)H-hydrate epimerase [Actinomycetales bacterium]
MISAHSIDAVRRAERAAMEHVPAGALMQRAAAALAVMVADRLRDLTGGLYGRHVALLIGPGSNGGDALWAGARLAQRGVVVRAVLTSPSTHAEGLAALRASGGLVTDVSGAIGDHPGADTQHHLDRARATLTGADVVVDGLLGIGGRAGLRRPAADLVAALDPDSHTIAVDLPSGVDPDTGAVDGPHVVADLTVTFGTVKPCLLLPPANSAAGEVVLVDIGLDPAVLGAPEVTRLEPGDVALRWPVPTVVDDKYSRGVLGVVAGGRTYTGAAVLCSGAAVRAGAGMVRYVGPEHPTELVRAAWPEVVPGSGRVQAWALGSGVDPDDREQATAVRDALSDGVPSVLDAGALDLLEPEKPGGSPADHLLTPHAGELARLLSRLTGRAVERHDVEARPLEHARVAAERTGATVLLKGGTALLVAPDGRVRAQPDGPHWLATAGSGDVLAGLAGTLLAAGLDAFEAGSLAVVVHARAGALASSGGPVSAGTVLDAVPAAVAGLLTDTAGADS